MAIQNNFPALNPTLLLDFANMGRLDPRVTFTRASTATFFNSLGVLTTANNDVARFTYDPATLAPQGLLIEEQRTNLLTYSEQFDDAAWTKVNATITANTLTAPSGSITADSLIEDSNTGTHRIRTGSIAASASTNYTLSVFAKAASGPARYLGITLSNTTSISSGARRSMVVDLLDGSTLSTGGATWTLVAATATAIGNGWYRCALTVTTDASATAIFCTIGMGDAFTISSYVSGYTGDGTSGIFIWGAQLEVGAFATSYIPTTTTALTRNADVASMTGTNFSGWYNQSAGTFVVQSQQLGTGNAFIFTASDGTVNNRIAQFRNGTTLSNRVVTGGSATNPGDLTIVSQSLVSSAIAATAGSAIAAANGTLSSASTPVSLPTIDRLGIGVDNASATPLNGTIRRIAYYPVRVSDAQLQALTT